MCRRRTEAAEHGAARDGRRSVYSRHIFDRVARVVTTLSFIARLTFKQRNVLNQLLVECMLRSIRALVLLRLGQRHRIEPLLIAVRKVNSLAGKKDPTRRPAENKLTPVGGTPGI